MLLLFFGYHLLHWMFILYMRSTRGRSALPIMATLMATLLSRWPRSHRPLQKFYRSTALIAFYFGSSLNIYTFFTRLWSALPTITTSMASLLSQWPQSHRPIRKLCWSTAFIAFYFGSSFNIPLPITQLAFSITQLPMSSQVFLTV